MTAGSHGSTFGGNPLAMAVANAVLDVVLAEGFLEGVERTGGLLQLGLEGLIARHPEILEALRGSGLMLGLKCVVPAGEMMKRLRDEGLLTVAAAENVVRLVPPLTIEAGHVDEALTILDRVCGSWAKAGAA
jgi:acetylornithine/N-succinyldiaminopimelate aminotransferase